MKRVIMIALAAVMLLGLPLMAAAVERTSCTIAADSINTAPGETVRVPVRISGNRGFTNFAVRIDYDHGVLELISIDASDALCGPLVSENTAWTDESGNAHGYITAASAQAIAGDGVLFTAVFAVSESFHGSTAVTPQVQYIRNNTAFFPVFEEITASVEAGVITAVTEGDVNGDGNLEYDDVWMAYQASIGENALTAAQTAAADLNGDGVIDQTDVEGIYQIYCGG